jgi:dihydroorotase
MVNGTVLLRGGRVVDPVQQLDGRADIRMRDGTIAAVGKLTPEGGERVIDVGGLTIVPGLVDVHVHLREPGQEWKETIATGTAAAAVGGFTTIFCMPNTEPPLDSVAALEELKRRTARDALVNVRPIAAISEGRRGQVETDYDALRAAGAIGFSDDGEPTRSARVMLAALRASRRLGAPAMAHCEDLGLSGGAMHDGDISRELDVPGIPAAAEEIGIARDLALAEAAGGWLHVCHVSTGRGAEMIAAAKRRGVKVTAEVMPHHLQMCEEWVAGRRRLGGAELSVSSGEVDPDPDAKVNPPLRTRHDTAQLTEALKGGTIDLVATDHAPHGRHEKQGRSMAAAAFGLSGSEFALPLMLALVRAGALTLQEVTAAMSTEPARLWNLAGGSLRPGLPADLVVFDPEERWIVEPERLASRGANTPLAGVELQGRVKMTFVAGDERHRDW